MTDSERHISENEGFSLLGVGGQRVTQNFTLYLIERTLKGKTRNGLFSFVYSPFKISNGNPQSIDADRTE